MSGFVGDEKETWIVLVCKHLTELLVIKKKNHSTKYKWVQVITEEDEVIILWYQRKNSQNEQVMD